MSKVTLKGSPVNTIGELPLVGSKAPEFSLVGTNLSEVKNADFDGNLPRQAPGRMSCGESPACSHTYALRAVHACRM